MRCEWDRRQIMEVSMDYGIWSRTLAIGWRDEDRLEI